MTPEEKASARRRNWRHRKYRQCVLVLLFPAFVLGVLFDVLATKLHRFCGACDARVCKRFPITRIYAD